MLFAHTSIRCTRLLSSSLNQGIYCLGFPCSSVGKESAWSAGDPGSIPGLGRSPGEGNGNPLQYPCLENLMDRGLQSMASQRVGHDWATNTNTYSVSWLASMSSIFLCAALLSILLSLPRGWHVWITFIGSHASLAWNQGCQWGIPVGYQRKEKA